MLEITEREWDTLRDQATGTVSGITGLVLTSWGALITCTDMYDVYAFFAAAGVVLERDKAVEVARSAQASVAFDGSPNGVVHLRLVGLQVTD